MLFNSLQFAFFLPLVVVAYYAAPARLRPGLLLLASYLFYASWNPIYLALIIGLTAVNFLLGLALERLRGRPHVGGGLLALAVAINLGVLVHYKYTAFLVGNLVAASRWLGAGVQA